MAFGLLAGICGGAGLVALYTGLARGRMGIVAPLSAVITAVVPIMAGALWQGLPGGLQVFGFGLALAAVWLLASRPEESGLRSVELVYSLLAGIGFGLFFLFIALAGRQSLFWPLMAARCGSIGLVAAMLAWRDRSVVAGSRLRGRPLLYAVLAGICDAAGNGFFVGAVKLGRLDAAAVLGSLYPAATVILAWLLLKERLRPRQWCGVCLALAALGCIAWPGA